MPTTYEPIATTTLGSAQSSVTFTGISQDYTDLVLIGSLLADNTTGRYAQIRVGNNTIDTASNYSDTQFNGDGSGAGSSRDTNISFIYTNPTSADWVSTTNPFVLIANFQNYSNTTTNKSVLFRFNNSEKRVGAGVGLWRSTAAINQIRLLTSAQNFAAGSTFTLYGIKSF
jgi:hypothetical protein